MRCSKRVALFDHLVGERKQIWWNIQPKGLGGFEIDDQFQICWLFDR